MKLRKLIKPLVFTGLAGCLLLPALLNAQEAEQAPVVPALIDSDFEKADTYDLWPQGWPQIQQASWEEEDGNGFLRMTSEQPGQMVMMYREIWIPAGVEAFELRWKQRVSNLKRGEKSWFDARILMEFLDEGRNKVSPNPPTPKVGKDTNGWEEKSVRFNLPEGAAILKFMPSLFQVEAGTFDLDDVVLQPIPKLPPEEDPAYQRQLAKQQKAEAQQNKAAATLEAHGSLIPNGDMQADSNGDGKPDYWGGGNFKTENGNRFLRIHSDKPDEMFMYYREIDLPAGVEALELSLDMRTTNLKAGAEAWFDARIMMKFKDMNGKEVKPGPKAIYTRRSSDSWVNKTSQFLVPEGAVKLEFMPSLFKVRSGTLDLDNITLKPIDPQILVDKQKAAAAQKAKMHMDAEKPNKANWPSELKVVGNRLHDTNGNEVWLQGANIASLEWSAHGENVMKSAQVLLEGWKANVIRLPVKEEYWFNEKNGSDYRELVDNVITYAANRGAYVVLDLHRYRAATADHAKFWRDAGTRYKNHPAVLFDLLNEPHSTSWEIWRNGGFVEQKRKGSDEDNFLTEAERKHNKQGFEAIGMQALLDAVREVGANNIVVVGGLDWAYDLTGILNGYALDEHADGNGIMYSTHVYPWKKGWQKKFLDVAEKYPILVGEVGADAKKMDWMDHKLQEDAETWVPDMLGVIQKYRLNWTAWCFHPKASPRMLLDWDYTPTPVWGVPAKEAFSGKQFELKKLR